MKAMLTSKSSEVDRLRSWQEGDKYLGEDQQLRDIIENNRLQTRVTAEKE